MHISKLSYQPIFGTSYRKVYVPDKTFLLDHEASTCFYKSDFQWNKGTDFFIDFYDTFFVIDFIYIFFPFISNFLFS